MVQAKLVQVFLMGIIFIGSNYMQQLDTNRLIIQKDLI